VRKGVYKSFDLCFIVLN